MKKIQVIPVLMAMTLPVMEGCVYGRVMDADTNSGINNAEVAVKDGVCAGNGCSITNAAGDPFDTTDNNGTFVFDAYTNDPGYDQANTDIKILGASSGKEAIEFEITANGYQSRTVYHKPDYQNYEHEGSTYQYTEVPITHLCPVGSPDNDGDTLCNDAEIRYGTDPDNSDTDGDSLSDTAEIFGYNGVDLPGMGADPLRKNLFIEADYYPGLKPNATAVQKVIDAFAAAPVSNPDGSTGITLVIDVDDQITAADVDNDLSPVWTDFDVIKNKYFPVRRNQVFHYALIVNRYNGGSSSGISRGIPAQDFVVSMGNWATAGGTVQQQAGTLMHEFGHNLGLRHGGNQNTNRKINYISIMSYNYQLGGLRIDGVNGEVDYSRLRIASVSESNLNEVTAMAPVASTTEADLARYGVRDRWGWLTGNASANLDFNRNGSIQSSVAKDLDGDGNSTDNLQHHRMTGITWYSLAGI